MFLMHYFPFKFYLCSDPLTGFRISDRNEMKKHIVSSSYKQVDLGHLKNAFMHLDLGREVVTQTT